MKKIILFASILITSTLSFAQKNSILIGGNFEINSQKDNLLDNAPFGGGVQSSKQSDLTFTPTVGYQINNNFTLGVTASFKSLSYNSTITYPYVTPTKQETNQKNTQTNFGAFLRYSKTISNTFIFYGQFETLLGTSKNYKKQENIGIGFPNIQESTLKGNSTNLNLFPAIFINVKNNFGINLNFGGVSYSENKFKNYSGSESNFNFNLGKVINFGISKNFSTSSSKKKKK